jgi:hypothetical protein
LSVTATRHRLITPDDMARAYVAFRAINSGKKRRDHTTGYRACQRAGTTTSAVF